MRQIDKEINDKKRDIHFYENKQNVVLFIIKHYSNSLTFNKSVHNCQLIWQFKKKKSKGSLWP